MKLVGGIYVPTSGLVEVLSVDAENYVIKFEGKVDTVSRNRSFSPLISGHEAYCVDSYTGKWLFARGDEVFFDKFPMLGQILQMRPITPSKWNGVRCIALFDSATKAAISIARSEDELNSIEDAVKIYETEAQAIAEQQYHAPNGFGWGTI